MNAHWRDAYSIRYGELYVLISCANWAPIGSYYACNVGLNQNRKEVIFANVVTCKIKASSYFFKLKCSSLYKNCT